MPVTIVELKTGAPVWPAHGIQATVQKELARLNPELTTPGLFRHDEGDSHHYTLNGVEIPSLTDYLKQIQIFPYRDKYNAQRGTWLHEKCADIDKKGMSAGDDILCFLGKRNDPDKEFLIDCISSYMQFKKDYGLGNVYVRNEVPLASKALNVAATLDKVFETSDSKLILLYLGKKHKAIEISKREQTLHLNEFYGIKMYCQLTNWGKLPNDASGIVADRLEVIAGGRQVKKDLREYICELRSTK